jgi:DNA-binding NarL/FixJ family response regulator
MNDAQPKAIKQTRILVADDQVLIRVGLKTIITRHADLLCCGEAGSTDETLLAVESQRPDLLLLDLWLDNKDGLETIKSLKARFPSLLILVLSQLDEMIYAERVLRAGAHGYLMKEHGVKEVMKAIRTILAGEMYVSQKTASRILHKTIEANGGNRMNNVNKLTNRELQILLLLGAGMSTKKIAAEINLSFKTVETHRENIKHKLELDDAVQLIHYASAWLHGQTHPQINGARSSGIETR